MKAKLIKTEKMYVLSANDAELHKFKSAIDTDNYGWVIADVHGEGILKLSAKNCDEIFGVFNVEKLVEKYDPNYAITDISNGFHFIEGFNKAMELNKDKLFTLEDVKKVIKLSREKDDYKFDGKDCEYKFQDKEIIQSLQQPTEIEVEIEMGQMKLNDDGQKYGFPDMTLPKLDSNRCLILKRVK
jgi:hypothetical protein